MNRKKNRILKFDNMKHRITLTAAAAVLALTASSQSSFDEVLTNAVASNPDIVALELSSKSEIELLKAENVLEGPEIEAGHEWGHYGDRNMHVGISQSFDWPGLYKARRDHTRSTASALDALKQSTLVDKTLEAKTMLIEIIAAKRKLVLLNEMQSTMEQLNKRYAESYNHGEVSILDVNKIEIELLKATRAADEQRTLYDNLISGLCSFASTAAIGSEARNLAEYPAETLLSETEYEEFIKNADPTVIYRRSMSEVAEDNARIAKLSAMPGFSVGYELSREENQNFNGITVAVKLPRWNNRHASTAARLAKLENETLLNTAVMRSVIEMRNDLETASDLDRQAKGYARILDNGRQAELLKKAFDGGQINLLNYLLELNYFVEARLDYENVCYELSLVKARLNRLHPFTNR